jgi:hypothetical protein
MFEEISPESEVVFLAAGGISTGQHLWYFN